MPIKLRQKLIDVILIEKESSKASALNVLVIGVFHGEEPQGKYIIERYLNEKDFLDIKNNMYFIPCLNPYGMGKNVRGNKNGVDINRNYPTRNWELSQKDEFYSGPTPASETETKFMMEVLEKVKPHIILTLHAPLKCVNFDGPARAISKKISEITCYPVLENIGYPLPAHLGRIVVLNAISQPLH